MQKLQATGNFDAANMNVTFVPEEDDEPGLEWVDIEEGPEESQFEIGRVSVYLA